MADHKKQTEEARAILVRGRVQGVGFRPYIYRLATALNLRGEVGNLTDGVSIHVEGDPGSVRRFTKELPGQAPVAAIIKEIRVQEVPLSGFKDFSIIPSRDEGDIIAEVCPDIAVCNDCLKELRSEDRRKDYPFINCTNCGPRFTIIEDYPYDRKHTSMHKFEMCPVCAGEYQDVSNRRFHAQPVSCFDCGPVYVLHVKEKTFNNFELVIQILGQQINAGSVVAIKGLGGYNLACDAFNEAAVTELRRFKKREKKPFAVMFRSLQAMMQAISISPAEAEALQSWRRPIVILNGRIIKPLAEGVTAGLKSLGAFLPYIPLHYLLFDQLETDALVLTSGNESDTPILYEDDRALQTFQEISGGILTNTRPIARRADDSVVRVIGDHSMLMRRARGYTPSPVDLNFSAEGILAAGAELSNAFCIGKNHQAILSQHIGDLKNYETLEFYRENIEKFSSIYRFKAQTIACDLHPDYLSTRYAKESGLPVIETQHHHAHVASVMAEHGIREPVVGIAWDGTGYGTDDRIWGSETMIADFESFERVSHFEYIPCPGGDLVTKEPWRMGLSYLYTTLGEQWDRQNIPLNGKIDRNKGFRIVEAVQKGINAPLSCSAGRLFDAVAALLGICTESSYHAQAPQLLENYLVRGIDESYDFAGSDILSFSPMIRKIILELTNRISADIIVTKFHNTMANAALWQVKTAAKKRNLSKVVLSGGSFQNKYLTEKLVHLLHQNRFEVFLPREVSCNDGGIALGQLAIAAHKINKDKERGTI